MFCEFQADEMAKDRPPGLRIKGQVDEMTMKSITGEDLLKYVKRRREYLRLTRHEEVMKQPEKDREKVRRMMIGRDRELEKFENLICENLIEHSSKDYAKKIYFMNTGIDSDSEEQRIGE